MRFVPVMAMALTVVACAADLSGRRGFEIAADPAFRAAYPSLAAGVGDLMDVSGPSERIGGATAVSGCRTHVCPYAAACLACVGGGSGMLARTEGGRPGVSVETVGDWRSAVPTEVREAYGKWLEGLSQSPLPTPR